MRSRSNAVKVIIILCGNLSVHLHIFVIFICSKVVDEKLRSTVQTFTTGEMVLF